MSTLTPADIPTTGLAEFVAHGVRFVRTDGDELADVISSLPDSLVNTDANEELIVELKRSLAIDAATIVALLGNYGARNGSIGVASHPP